ncbi:hypothetical protein GCM10008027_41720 [Pseudoalteromonas gelatinilytica]|uniref:Uncharacterized protein n=1 Tax=Pseudoalteromonas gelatinilytica TaxID=1703256 RepID=A0ABQ1U8B9_9GAMM|nr:hypothetical protein GCM10008027_41720 [Pseudoalteromonas profundi]
MISASLGINESKQSPSTSPEIETTFSPINNNEHPETNPTQTRIQYRIIN